MWPTAYVPARELGGDFYDLLPYGVGRWPSPTVTFREKAPPRRFMVPGHWYPA